jgi:formylglycine-generating enzyme required for sulfatase activity
VTVGGEYRGESPVTLELLSGNHALRIAKELYREATLEVNVIAGQPQTLRIELQFLPARLTITGSPQGAGVTMAGEFLGTLPLTLPVPSGLQQELRVTAPGYRTSTQALMFAPGAEERLEIHLEQERGLVYLSTVPAEATVFLNGKQLQTPLAQLRLPATEHLLEVRAPGYQPVTRTVTPREGFSQQISVVLQPAAKTPSVAGTVPGKEELVTGQGQRLRLVRPTPFTMGAPRREPGRRANERERSVIMKRPYYLAEKLVTNGEFRRYQKQHSSGQSGGYSLDGEDQPVVRVRWEDAVRYLNWLSEEDNLEPYYVKQGETYAAATPQGSGYRLPSEAEWAFAARKAQQKSQRFPWRGGYPPRSVMANFADETAADLLPRVLPGYNDGFPVTSPVGSFPANQGGFFDFGGNVAEWCHDYYSAYTGALDNSVDPLGPVTGIHRVIRGSSWRDSAITELRLSYRGYHREARDNVGFRVARYL